MPGEEAGNGAIYVCGGHTFRGVSSGMLVRAVGEEVSGRGKRGPSSKLVGHVASIEWTSVLDIGTQALISRASFYPAKA